MQCVNKNSREYQALLKESGIPDFILSAKVGRFLEKLNRWPYLDELKDADSEKAIKENLNLNKDNITQVSSILEATNSSNIKDAVPKLNDKYRDKEIEVVTIQNEAKVYITPRPKEVPINSSNNVDENVNSFLYLNQILDKLQNLYGINIQYISNVELLDPKWEDLVDIHSTKAFIHNGTIYVNTDMATIDSPLHEMLHILFGSLKFQNRSLYDQLVSSAENFNQEIIELYPNRTRQDLNEEAFITELARYLTNQQSALDNIDPKIQYEIFYNINRTLDTVLMGETSVNCIPNEQLYQMNLKTIAKLVNSTSMNSNFNGSMNNATLNRILANKKSELMEKGELKEECK